MFLYVICYIATTAFFKWGMFMSSVAEDIKKLIFNVSLGTVIQKDEQPGSSCI